MNLTFQIPSFEVDGEFQEILLFLFEAFKILDHVHFFIEKKTHS